MAFGKKKPIRIEFLDAKDEQLIGFDELLLKQIPEDFKDDTWVEIDGDRWKVVKVDPSSARKAKREGLLTVHVNLVERRTPIVEAEPVAEEVKEIPVFRNPSRADQLPRMSGKRGELQLLEIASYEWRDIEFVVASNRSSIKDVFGKIAELISLNSTERDGRTFYTRQYDRYDMFAPMRGTRLPLEVVITEYFPAARGVDGLTFMGSDQVADSTFVFRVNSGIAFYGQEFDDAIRYFGLTRPAALDIPALRADAATIASLMKRKDLVIVDWQRREIVEATEEAVHAFFLKEFREQTIVDDRREASLPVAAAISLAKPAAVPEPPKTEAIVTEATVTEPSKTEAIVTEAIVTEPPKTEAIVTEAIVTEPPKTEAIVTEATVTEPPHAETIASKSAVNETVESPTTQLPAIETPVVVALDLNDAAADQPEIPEPIEPDVLPEEEPAPDEVPAPEELPEIPMEPMPETLPDVPEIPSEPIPDPHPDFPEIPSLPEMPMPQEFPAAPSIPLRPSMTDAPAMPPFPDAPSIDTVV